ncbi:MAG: thymidine kinase [Chlamydiia bacterium]
MAKVYFYYSAMNAGKSTTLLQASYNYIERGMQTLIFAPQIDQRFGSTCVYSRIGLKQDAIPFDPNFNFFEYVAHQLEQTPNVRCILVDEANFLKKEQVMQLSKIATDLKIAVLCYGLRTDFLGEPFEGSRYLLAWAEEITEIKTICQCGRKATMNMRIDGNGNPVCHGEQIQVGGNESYISQCMKCYKQNVPNFNYRDIPVEAL